MVPAHKRDDRLLRAASTPVLHTGDTADVGRSETRVRGWRQRGASRHGPASVYRGGFHPPGMVLNIRNASPLNGYLFECSRESSGGAPNGPLTSKHIAVAATGFKAEAAVRKLVPNPDILILIESGPHILKRARELGMQDGEARASLGFRQSLPTRDEKEAQDQENESIHTQAKRLAETQGLKWKNLTADRRREFRNEAKGARDVGSGASSEWQT